MMHIFNRMSALPMALLFLGGFALFASIAVLVVQKWLPWLHLDHAFTEYGQIFGGAIGTMFALVYALVTIAVWQNYDRVNAGVAEEAKSLHNIYSYLEAYPLAVRDPVRRQLRAYLQEVIQVEWPSLAEGRQDPVAGRLIGAIEWRLATYKPASLGELALHQEVLAQLSLCRGQRYDRIQAGSAYLDLSMWVSLWIGSVILLVFCSAWRMPSRRQHLFLTGALGGSLGIIFFLMLAYNHPFVGPGAIGPGPLQHLMENHWRME